VAGTITALEVSRAVIEFLLTWPRRKRAPPGLLSQEKLLRNALAAAGTDLAVVVDLKIRLRIGGDKDGGRVIGKPAAKAADRHPFLAGGGAVIVDSLEVLEAESLQLIEVVGAEPQVPPLAVPATDDGGVGV
jgi:hypothetical protein